MSTYLPRTTLIVALLLVGALLSGCPASVNHLEAGKSARSLGDLQGAIGHFEAYRLEHPEDTSIERELGLLYAQRGLVKKAIPTLAAWLETTADDEEVRVALADAYLAAGEYPKAEAEYAALVAATPTSVDYAYKMARVSYIMMRFSDAIENAQKALTIDEGHLPSLILLGRAQKELGKVDQAELTLKKAISVAPDSAEAFFHLGTVYQTLKLTEPAIDAYKKCLSLAPDFGEAMHNLGIVYVQAGEYALASAVLKEAMSIFPDDVAILNNLGVSYSFQGLHCKALETFETALKLAPGSKVLAANIADTNYRMGKLAEAKAITKKLISQGAQPEENRAFLKKLLVVEVYTSLKCTSGGPLDKAVLADALKKAFKANGFPLEGQLETTAEEVLGDQEALDVMAKILKGCTKQQ